jgi:hypothetical protein
MRNYWCYRIAAGSIDIFRDELLQGRLRQGWGYDKGQDLRNFTVDEGAAGNKPMFNKVKKGDILLVPRISSFGEVAVVEATEDWNTGYRFEIDSKTGDYGHIFPAKLIKAFVRDSAKVSGNIRKTLKNRQRFWNINYYAKDVDDIINAQESELSQGESHADRFTGAIKKIFSDAFDENKFSKNLYTELTNQFSREEWEFALVYALRKMFPYYTIERVGGTTEVKHGTDILVKLPSIIADYEYAIAIQVKDYEGFVGDQVIDQINKADGYWNDESLKLIDKIIIVIKADKEQNSKLLNNNSGVKIIFAKELEQLLCEIGKIFVGEQISTK